MAMVIEEAKIDGIGDIIFTADNVYGVIRLWEEGAIPKPTNKYILVGDFVIGDIADGTAIKVQDADTFDTKMADVFQSAKVAMKDYGVSKGKSFRMDIVIPKEIINGYTK